MQARNTPKSTAFSSTNKTDSDNTAALSSIIMTMEDVKLHNKDIYVM